MAFGLRKGAPKGRIFLQSLQTDQAFWPVSVKAKQAIWARVPTGHNTDVGRIFTVKPGPDLFRVGSGFCGQLFKRGPLFLLRQTSRVLGRTPR